MKFVRVIATVMVAVNLVATPVSAKTIVVDQSKVTQKFLQKHQNDTIYTYIYGIRINKNGDGVDKDGYYIAYDQGKIGTKYTTIMKYADHPRDIDDWELRIDYKGWNKPSMK